MTKKQAFKMALCQLACNYYSKPLGKCTADLFRGRSPEGYLITVSSDKGRLSKEDIEIMKMEYGFNYKTGKIKK